MIRRKATLIQDLFEFRSLLNDALDRVLEVHVDKGLDCENLLLWIIKDAVEDITLMEVKNHRRKLYPHQMVRDALATEMNELGFDLLRLISHYIKLPRLFFWQELKIYYQGIDLVIEFEAFDPAVLINPFLSKSNV